MAQHTRRPGDKSFRRISLFGSETPKYEEFTQPNQMINFKENEQVLEILLEDGTEELFCGNAANLNIYYGNRDEYQIWLSCAERPDILPEVAARIWMKKESGGLRYKVPGCLKVEGTQCVFRVPGGATNVELVGDKYFDRVFQLIANR